MKLRRLRMMDDQLLAEFRYLDQCVDQLFPHQGEINHTVSTLGNDLKFRYNALTKRYLPYHTRDHAWLAMYVAENVTAANPKHAVPYRTARKYVTFSPKFDKRRNQFEEDFVKGYLGSLSHNLPPVWDQCLALRDDPNYDHKFRRQVIRAMQVFGLNRHRIEASLEHNANLWRDAVMLQTYKNNYAPALSQPEYYQQFVKDRPDLSRQFFKWCSVRDAHQDLWLQRREYQYYQKHQDLIDALGTATPGMQITPQQAAQLDADLAECDALRQSLADILTLGGQGRYTDHDETNNIGR